MITINCSYKDISREASGLPAGSFCLDKKVVLSRMIDKLPQEPWINIELLAWEALDNKLQIEYFVYNSPFGEVLVANTHKGICYLGLVADNKIDLLEDLRKRYRLSELIATRSHMQEQAIRFFEGRVDVPLHIHVKGTPYQIEIWRKLIRIPYGKVVSYATLGGSAQCARAAGTANGRNPIFFIVPCQRAVKTTGEFDRYFWGNKVKKQLLAWEFTNSSD